jgi:predicted MFS family arabinose efflux permease
MTEAWKRFSILYLIQFLQLLDFISISPTGAIFVEHRLITSNSISFGLGAYSLTAICASFAVPKISKGQTKKTLMILIGIFCLAQILLASSVTQFTFILARIIGGMTGGVMGALAYSQLSWISTEGSGKWNGLIQTAQSIVSLVGIPACLMIVSKFGTVPYFLGMSILSCLTIIAVNNSVIVEQSSAKSNHSSLKVFLNHSDIIFTGFVIYLAAFLFISQLPNYLINELKISTQELSLAYSLSGIATLTLAAGIGKLGDSINTKILLIISCVMIIPIQILFQLDLPIYFTLYFGLPVYLLLSTGRAIQQRGIILSKKDDDSVSMHLINNIAIRAGILVSGLILGLIATFNSDIKNLFMTANYASILCGISVIVTLTTDILLKRRKTTRIH